MKTETELAINVELPEATGTLVDHDYSNISPTKAFQILEEQNRKQWNSDTELNRGVPSTKPFIMLSMEEDAETSL